MIIGKVIGSVVCTQKDQSLKGIKMLCIQPIHIISADTVGSPIVALDAIGAGVGEMVMIVGGSSARNADGFAKVAVDQSIIAIVDTIEIEGINVFKK